MKGIILSFILFSSGTFAGNEISDEAIADKFMTVFKGKEITQTLSGSEQVNKCTKEHKFEKGQASNSTSLNNAIECFKKSLTKDPKKLGELADSLELEKFGLIKSKNSEEITSFLSDKMYEAMTGIDVKERDQQKIRDQLLFKNRKIIDQKVFFEMYVTQLQKNAMFEVSRFCFENFRDENNKDLSTFDQHWKNLFNNTASAVKETDTGSAPIGLSATSFTEKDQSKLQEEILLSMGNIQNSDKVKSMGVFFNFCMSKIIPLCAEFEIKVSTTPATGAPAAEMPKGANACLTKGRIQALRKTLVASQKILSESFNDIPPDQLRLSLTDVNAFVPNGDKSIDNLTSVTSQDAIQGDGTAIKAAEDCLKNSSDTKCDSFVQVGDQFAEARHDIELKLSLKKEVEIARINALKSENTNLEKFLEDNGYVVLLKKFREDPGSVNFEKEIAAVFEAKKIAALAQIDIKLGKRQLTEAEAAKTGTRDDVVKLNAQIVLEEKARLAQVILFNNIITSQLAIQEKDSGKELGRNISGLKKEIAGLKSSGVEEGLFEGLKTNVDSQPNNSSDINGGFSGFGIIDTILGQEPK